MQSKLEKLERDFDIEWREFKIGDLFEVGTGSLVDSQDLKEGSIPRISVKTTDNGIIGYYSSETVGARYFENFISVNFFGGVFYHPYRASVEMKVHTLRYTDRPFTRTEGIYLTGVLGKCLEGAYSYGNQLSSTKLKKGNLRISLPTVKGELALSYMEEFVRTLEAERLATLDASLSVAGLKDCELTAEDRETLEQFNSLNWREFNLSDLFGPASRGRRLKSADRIEGSLPFVTAGEFNTGISAWIGNDVTVYPSNTITIDMFGSAKYRNYEYGADDHIAVLHTQDLNPFAVPFITACVEKVSHAGQFDYSRNFYASDADELNIVLPVNETGEIDFGYMERFIKAMQKVAIMGVVEYLDLRLDKTAEIIKS